MIKIDFEFNTQYGIFRDAIYIPENHSYSIEEIENIKQQRLNNWISIVDGSTVQDVGDEVEELSNTTEINGEIYQLLEGVPPSGAKLIEINQNWYYKI